MTQKPLTEIGFRAMAETITRLRRRNAQLRAHNTKLAQTRDEWKRKARRRAERIEYLTVELRKCRARMPRRSSAPRPRVTEAQRAEHHAIVDRILAIPPRDIL